MVGRGFQSFCLLSRAVSDDSTGMVRKTQVSICINPDLEDWNADLLVHAFRLSTVVFNEAGNGSVLGEN
jgi:hypothetical protein